MEYQHDLEVELDRPTQCSVTVQNLFRKYQHLCGMTVRSAVSCPYHATSSSAPLQYLIHSLSAIALLASLHPPLLLPWIWRAELAGALSAS